MAPSLNILEKSGDKYAVDGNKKIYKLRLLIRGESHVFLNVLKRVIEEDVKTLAIDDVYIHSNTSAMWDEFIAHRLGLVVLNTPENYSYDKTVRLSLRKKGGGYVLASDLRIEDNNVYTPYPDTIIAYLDDDKEIHLEMIAKFGSGREHIKWKPAHVYYYRTADVVIKEKLDDEDIKKLKELGVNIKKDKIEIPKDKIYDRTFIDAIQSINKEKIEVIPKDEFVFIVESYGSISAEKIVKLGLIEMKNKVKNLINEFMK